MKIQIVATNLNFLPNKLNFCCGNYSREETIQGRKLSEEIRYLIKKVPYLESRIRNAVFTKTSHYIYNEKWHPAEEKYTHYNTDGNSSLKRLRKYYD